MKTNGLTQKQAAFVQEYLIDLNAAGAARRAGYSKKTARVIGPENLSKPVIQEAINNARSERAERTEVTADWVITKLVENVKRAMQAKPVTDSKGRRTGEYRYDGAVANQALRHLGQHLGMFTDRVELKIDVLERLASLPASVRRELEALGDEELMSALKQQVWQ